MKSVADIKVGYLCNNRCLHCAIGDMKRDLEQDRVSTDLTTEQVFQLLEQQSKDADCCVLTGGEITLRKDCAQLINKAISLYKSVQIQTNGRRITQQLIDSICDLKKCNFAVAVHGSQPIHDAITHVKNSYTQTVEGLKVLSRAHAETCLKFVLSRVNYKDIDHVVQLADQLDFRRINIAYVHGCGDARVNIDQLLVPYEEIQPYVTRALEKSEQYGIFTDLETFPLCKIDPRFYYCSDDVYMGKTVCTPVHEDSYDWEYARKVQNKTKPEQCAKCFFRNVCEGHWSEYNLSEMQPMYTNRPPLSGPNEIIIKKLKLMKALAHE